VDLLHPLVEQEVPLEVFNLVVLLLEVSHHHGILEALVELVVVVLALFHQVD
jgi:hypothetical protein|tara:strand:+ start:32 stop:187 length:156 start_codon:yes stop_codon:yes gene_type:complete